TIRLDQTTAFYGEQRVASLVYFENVDGSSFDDSIVGTDDRNLLQGFEGSDDLDGLDGQDELYGMAGNDVLLITTTYDFHNINNYKTLDGGAGIDTVDYSGATLLEANNSGLGILLDRGLVMYSTIEI